MRHFLSYFVIGQQGFCLWVIMRRFNVYIFSQNQSESIQKG